MRGLNDRKFLNLFQIVHRASCPDPTNSRARNRRPAECAYDFDIFLAGANSKTSTLLLSLR
jgi:hypothetical protein